MIGLLLLVMSTGCGKKGPVRPKLTTLPSTPEDLTLRQQGNLFVLGWTIPSADLIGNGQEDVTGFRIRRLTYDAADGCPTCRDPQEVVADLKLKSPAPGQRIGKRMYWRDLDIRPGIGYRYAISPVALGSQEGPAASIHLEALQPPPAPTALHLEAGDARVLVKWDAPVLPEGMQLVGYNLYRRQAQRPFPIVPLNASPLQATRLLDRGLDNGRTYEYRVSALVRSGERLLESMASPGAQVTPLEGR
jgi:hypothetical protein